MRVKNVIVFTTLTMLLSSVNAQTKVDIIKDSDLHKFNLIFSNGTKTPTFDVSEDDVLSAESRLESKPVNNFSKLSVHQDPTKLFIKNLSVPVVPNVEIPPIDESESYDINSTKENNDTSVENDTQTDTSTIDINVTEEVNTDIILDKNVTTNKHHIDTDISTEEEPIIEDTSTTVKNIEDDLSSKKNADVGDNLVTNQNNIVSTSVFSNPTSVNVNNLVDPNFNVGENIPMRTPEEVPQLDIKINDWDTVIDEGSGWKSSTWFGWYFGECTSSEISNGTWIYHLHLKWVYIASDSFESVWMWCEELDTWIWTSGELFPYLFNNSTGDWMYFDSEQKLMYDYTIKKYIDLNPNIQ